MTDTQAKEMLTHGKGNFINCTDYDEAIKAIKQAYQIGYEKGIEDGKIIEREGSLNWIT